MMSDPDGRKRVIIERVSPEIDCGQYAAKITVGERLTVEADVFCDGHDRPWAALLFRREGSPRWSEIPMQPLPNDRWRASFLVTDQGRYEYSVLAGVDHFGTWHHDLRKKIHAGVDVAVDLLIGGRLIQRAAERAERDGGGDGRQLAEWAALLGSDAPVAEKLSLIQDGRLLSLLACHRDRDLALRYPRVLRLIAERERARFSTWYELFPRSTSGDESRHGTFRDVERRLPAIAGMGFDILYLPPIHPIGLTKRKGKNNALVAGPDDPGSPWAIGGPEGGHTAVHPQLGTLADFRRLVRAAADLGIEIALDIALQCSPDHPYVRDHPEWFTRRPDGAVQYAENPPKKYEDIYPFNFECDDWRALWAEILGIFQHWIEHGVRVFRVDNPHTKPFRMWDWLIEQIHRDHPDVLFLAEAFTRPKVMYRLAKGGFTQSYTYFAWRNEKWDLTEYLRELTATEARDFFRPNFWPNTPDILTEFLQRNGRAGFLQRLVLAATLAASYGIYGPAFELMESTPRHEGSEEYLNSEKYQLRAWDLDRPDSLSDFIARVNQIRRENPALQSNRNLAFHTINNDQLIAYSKATEDRANVILCVVNLDPHHTQSGWIALDLNALGLAGDQPFQVHDLLSNARFQWTGARTFVELDPRVVPAHIFRIRRRLRSERDFDYYL